MKPGFWLSDEQWALIEPHLPYRSTGRRRVDDRRIISGIIHVLQSGCRWRDFPAEYGPHTTVYNRYNRWSQKGIWQYMFTELTSALARPSEEVYIDSTHVKAHRSTADGKGGLLFRPSGIQRRAQHQDSRYKRQPLPPPCLLCDVRPGY